MSNLHQATLQKVVSLVSALREHANVSVKTGLLDVASSIEVLVSTILHETDDLQLKNVNLLKVNFPAIDLADDGKRLAIQVTTNVSTAKWKETVKKFQEHNLSKKYDQLRIIGFCDAVAARGLPAWVSVEGPDVLLQRLKLMGPDELLRLEDRLRASYDFAKLTPLRDEHCFSVVLGVLNRDAIRHHTSVEGSFADLTLALREVRQIINAGSVPEKKIYAKPISQYGDEYRQLLEDVDHLLGTMLAEVNRSKVGNHYDLGFERREMVDSARSRIIDLVNAFCERHEIATRITPIR